MRYSSSFFSSCVGILAGAGTFLFSFFQVFAQGYTITTPIPGVRKGATPAIETYVRDIYLAALGVAGVVALVQIVWGAALITVGGAAPDQLKEGKKKIIGALIGLVLLFASWLILYTINPDLVSLTPPKGF